MRFFLFLIFVSMVTFGQDTLQKNWKCIDENHYTICYPDSMTFDKSSMMQSAFVLFFPINKEGLFRTSINLMIQDLKGSSIDNLDQFSKLSEKQITTLVSQGTILESKDIFINDMPFHAIVFTGIYERYFLKWAQYYAIKDNKAYVLTFTSTINQFAYYENTARQIVQTFKIQ